MSEKGSNTGKVLTIAGSDTSGGAGIQADLRVFSRLGVDGFSVIAAVTSQTQSSVNSIFPVPTNIIESQMDTLFDAFKFNVVKTGMLYSSKAIELIAEKIRSKKINRLIVDPVIKSSSNHWLIEESAIKELKRVLFPLAYLVTPNIYEAQYLSGVKINNISDVEKAAKIIYELGPQNVLITGGHLKDYWSTDLLFNGTEFIKFKKKKVPETQLHGSGCVFSAAIAANLAKDKPLKESIRNAKKIVTALLDRL